MDNLKIKWTTFGDITDRFMTGFNKLGYETKSYKLTTKNDGIGLLDFSARIDEIYHKSKDCTYLALTPIGFIDLFGCNKNDICLVARFDGKVNLEADDFKEEPYKTLFEEIHKKWNEYIDKSED